MCSQTYVTGGGVFLFASGMIVSISCQEWKQHVEVAFETLKGPMELWWDQYIAWIYFVQCKSMQVMATGDKRQFI